MKNYMLITCLLGNLLLWGCSAEELQSSISSQNQTTVITTGNPTAHEILKNDPKADIFQWNGTIYQTNIYWVNELVLSEGDFVGVINYHTSNPNNFKDSSANVLPIGTEIYKVNERNDILLTKYNGELKYYYQLVEG
ncbi:hypothetical protein ACIQ34_09955 [Ureibacillus sp. NPDC094379]